MKNLERLNDRIKKLIETIGIKKIDFAKKLNVSQAFVSQLCSGASQPSDRTISDICREFGVSEEWLRTGEGEMFVPMTRDEEIAAFMGDLLSGRPDFRSKLISVLARLSPAEWELIEKMVNRLLDEETAGQA